MTGARLVVPLMAVLCAACTPARPVPDPLPDAAGRYIRLVGALGRHDPDSVESEGTLGDIPEATGISLTAIIAEANGLAAQLAALPAMDEDDTAFRRHHLIEQLGAVALRAREVSGATLGPAERAQLLGPWAALPKADVSGEHEIRASLNRLLPGPAPLSERLETFDARFTVAADRLPAVFERALRECRTRTATHIQLPVGEGVTIRYVTNRPWSGFSRYKGEGRSQIEVNTSFPLTVDRALELACHEGYPGHHVHNAIRDERLVRARHWHEFTVMPVFSPESFAAEAAASLATRLVFTDDERVAFERDVLFPLAGLNPAGAVQYLHVARLREALEPAIASVVADYIAGKLDMIEAGWALNERALMHQPLATLQFVNRYGGYSLAYTGGKTHVANALGEAAVTPRQRWRGLQRIFEAGAPVAANREKRDAG